MPGGWDVDAEGAVGLAALDEGLQGCKYRGVALVQLGLPVLLGVDGDERVVAPEALPARVDDGVEDAGDAALGVRAPARRVRSGCFVGGHRVVSGRRRVGLARVWAG